MLTPSTRTACLAQSRSTFAATAYGDESESFSHLHFVTALAIMVDIASVLVSADGATTKVLTSVD